MAGKRQPIDLLLAKGNKHFTKAEIALRRAQELHPNTDKVAPPSYLSRELKKRFNELAAELIELEVMTNLDCDALARLLIVEKQFVDLTAAIDDLPITREVEIAVTDEDGNKSKKKITIIDDTRAALLVQQDRAYKQCRQGATDFGLTISARCRITAPKKKKDVPENKFLKYAKA